LQNIDFNFALDDIATFNSTLPLTKLLFISDNSLPYFATPRELANSCKRFGTIYCFSLQENTTTVEKWGVKITHSPHGTILPREAYSFTPKMKETGFSEKFVAIY
jgi:hypothetical protein